jgi:phenylalanyl-tRNA synthetase beta chain
LQKISGGDESHWAIPGFRRELHREADLIEEISRVVGIEKIPSRAVGVFAPASGADLAYDFAMDLRRKLAGMGFHEARTSTLVSASAAPGDAVELKNPFGDDQSRLRNSLIPGLLSALARNIDQGAKSIPLFEVGRVFSSAGEFQRLTLVATGDIQSPDWRGVAIRAWDIFDLLGVVRHLVRLEDGDLKPLEVAPAPFGAASEVYFGGKKIGIAGQLHPSIARDLGVTTPLLAAEFDLAAWQAVLPKTRLASALPKFPTSSRDIAFLAPLDLKYGSVQSAVEALKEPLLDGIHLFDLFTDSKGIKIPADKKSLAIALTFRSSERTLTAEEVNAATDRIKATLRESLGVDFRE